MMDKNIARMEVSDWLEQTIAERIEGIVSSYNQDTKQYYHEQEIILASLEPGTRKKFEDFVESLGEWNFKEQVQIYKEAFKDGLRLGHKIF